MCKGVWQREGYVHVYTLKVKKRATDSLQPELQVVVSCPVCLLGTERGIPLLDQCTFLTTEPHLQPPFLEFNCTLKDQGASEYVCVGVDVYMSMSS